MEKQVIDLLKKKTQKEHVEFENMLSDVEVPLLEHYLDQFGETQEYMEYIELQKNMLEFIEKVMLMIKVSNGLMYDSENDKALRGLSQYRDKLNCKIKEFNEILRDFSNIHSKLRKQVENRED